MLDFKKPDKINEYDKIISEWSNGGSGQMKYLAVEDIKKKCWIVYDFETALYKEVPFGDYTEGVINSYVLTDKNSVHYKKIIDALKKDGISFNEKEMNIFAENSKYVISELHRTLSNISYWESLIKKNELVSSTGHHLSRLDFEKILLDEWKKYRFACFPKIWLDLVSLMVDNDPEYEELNLSVNKIVNSTLIRFCDYISFVDKEENFRNGKCFVIPEEEFLYYWDLYHVLVSNQTETPRICPRCQALFFSNNNKSLYCHRCKKESNLIRSENRKKSDRYLHKKIYDKLNNSKFYTNEEKEAFLAESNYYWDVVCGKQCVGSQKHYDNKIKTKEDYSDWLQRKLKYYTEKRK